MLKKIFIPLAVILTFSCTKEKEEEIQLIPPTMVTYNINHFDWIPDTTTTDSILLDFDGDNIFDLKFLVEKTYQGSTPSGGPYYNYFSKVISLNNNLLISLGTELDTSFQTWNCIEYGDLISENLTWKSSFILNGSVIFAGSIGLWDTNNNQGYLCLKFMTNQNNKWGWINLTSTINNITLNEYAINENINQLIKAGQTE